MKAQQACGSSYMKHWWSNQCITLHTGNTGLPDQVQLSNSSIRPHLQLQMLPQLTAGLKPCKSHAQLHLPQQSRKSPPVVLNLGRCLWILRRLCKEDSSEANFKLLHAHRNLMTLDIRKTPTLKKSHWSLQNNRHKFIDMRLVDLCPAGFDKGPAVRAETSPPWLCCCKKWWSQCNNVRSTQLHSCVFRHSRSLTFCVVINFHLHHL